MANNRSRYSLKYSIKVFLNIETILGFIPRDFELLKNKDFIQDKVTRETGLKYEQLFISEDIKDNILLFISITILISGILERVGVSLDYTIIDNSGFNKYLIYYIIIYINKYIKKVLYNLYKTSPVK